MALSRDVMSFLLLLRFVFGLVVDVGGTALFCFFFMAAPITPNKALPFAWAFLMIDFPAF